MRGNKQHTRRNALASEPEGPVCDTGGLGTGSIRDNHAIPKTGNSQGSAMKKIELTLACEAYDRTDALREGRIQPEGIDLVYLPMSPQETFWRMLRHLEFDAA